MNLIGSGVLGSVFFVFGPGFNVATILKNLRWEAGNLGFFRDFRV